MNPLFFSRTFCTSQRGAIFGLDARIALAVFGALSVIAGGYTVLSLDSIRAQALAKELRETGDAVEALTNDLAQDIHQNLAIENDVNAFRTLYDKTQLADARLQGRWLGPYLTETDSRDATFGERGILKRLNNASQPCVERGDTCYLWLMYGAVPAGVASELNDIFDDKAEPNAPTSGRIQWQQGEGNQRVSLFYRIAPALRGSW